MVATLTFGNAQVERRWSSQKALDWIERSQGEQAAMALALPAAFLQAAEAVLFAGIDRRLVALEQESGSMGS
jgi:hypothetical protein